MKKQLSLTARRYIIATLLFPLWGLGGLGSGFGLSAQVSVSNMATTYTANNNKISFTVSWTSAPHNNQIWVITDYIKVAGTATTGSWSRATVTAVTKNSGTGSVSTVSSNLGFWLTTSGSSGNANITATLQVAAGVDKFNWCAYALNTPPQAVLVAGGGYELKGTPPFVVNGTKLGDGIKTFGAGTCITTLTDATNNPDKILPAAPSITLSAGSSSQTATEYTALPTLKYTTANASGASLTSGSFPTGVSGSWTNNTYTISGTPTATGTFTYTVATTNSQSCTNASKTGTITVNPTISYTNCNTASITLGTVGFTSSATYSRNGLTISSPVTATYCDKTTYSGGNSPYPADCRRNANSAHGDLFSWCMVARYAAFLCPSPWRVPSVTDLSVYACGSVDPTVCIPNSLYGAAGWVEQYFMVNDVLTNGPGGLYWASTEYSATEAQRMWIANATSCCALYHNPKSYGMTLKCVK